MEHNYIGERLNDKYHGKGILVIDNGKELKKNILESLKMGKL